MDDQGYNLPKGNYETVTQNADIWVRYSPDDCNETGEWVSCPFEIIVRDANALFGGQIQVNKDEIPDWKSKVQEILGWIDASSEGVDDEHPFLYDEWLFNGFSGEYDIQNGIKIPVPVGCESDDSYTAGVEAKWRFNNSLPRHYGLLYLQDNIKFSYTGNYNECYTYANRAARESSFLFTGKLNSSQASFFGVPSVSMFEGGAGMGGSIGIFVFSKQGLGVLHLDLRIPTPDPRPTFSSMLYDLIRIAKAFVEQIMVDDEQSGVQLKKQSDKTKKITVPKGKQLTLDDCWMHGDACKGVLDDDKTDVILPEGIIRIESYFSASENLSSIVIPTSVTEIQENAFWNIQTLKDIYVPASVKKIGEDAFDTCNEETIIHTEKGSAAEKYAKDNDMKFDYDYGMNLSKDDPSKSKGQKQSGKSSKATLPKGERLTLDDCNMKGGICRGIYHGDTKTAIILPEGIQIIESSSFFDCDELSSIVISEGVIEIQELAFNDCKKLVTVVLPSSIRTIGESAFSFTAINTITIPNGCEEIGEECFIYCKSLTDVYVPASVKTIGERAFDTENEKTVIHTEKGSAAERYAKENSMKYDYNYDEG